MERISRTALAAIAAAALLFAVGIRDAYAYSGATDLTFDSSSGRLSGWSATWADWWDSNWSEQCYEWAYDPEYGEEYCVWGEGWEESASVDGRLYTPSNGLAVSGSSTSWPYAEVSYSGTPGEYGTWTAVGDHFVYQVVWRYEDGWGWYPIGSGRSFLGQTSAQRNVQECGDERGVIIQEYRSHGVGWVPSCGDFSTGGGTANFSWGELNRSPGSGHPPYGIVRNVLWTGLENTRSNYNRGGIVIDSGYRCPHGNAAVGGAAQSRHMFGDAADMHSSDHPWDFNEWDRLQQAAVAAGATFIEPYSQDPSHVHADWR